MEKLKRLRVDRQRPDDQMAVTEDNIQAQVMSLRQRMKVVEEAVMVIVEELDRSRERRQRETRASDYERAMTQKDIDSILG